MDINKNNYEAWLLDLSEGRLSADEVRQLRSFLLLNPECAGGTLEMDPWFLEPGQILYSGKDKLRKEIPDSDSILSEKDFDLFSVARMEGDLSASQERDYLLMIEKDEAKKKEWLQWEQLKLKGSFIEFKGKKDLKRRPAGRTRILWLSVASAAAALVLFFSLFPFDQAADPIAVVSPDREIEETKKAAPDARGSVEPDESSAQESTTQESSADAQPSGEPETRALQSPKISFKKYQDPPELDQTDRDQSADLIRESDLKVRPIKFAVLESKLSKPTPLVSYDRIETFDVGTYPEYAEVSTERRGFAEERDISLLSIASAGVDGVRRLTGSDVLLDVSRDADGEVKGFRFRSSLLSVESPVKKKNISR